MAINRRSLLAGMASSMFIGRPAIAAAEPALIGTGKQDGEYASYILDRGGRILSTVAMPRRGHGISVSSDRALAVTIARRPGRSGLAYRPTNGVVERRFACPDNRHFCGHGVFISDNRLFLATENDFDHERGVIGLYDTRSGFRRVGEFDTLGVGPHDIILLQDGKTIVVANGGIATHPDYPRQKLNISEMRPSISYIDLASGTVIEQVFLPVQFHKLSIRHLTIDRDGAVWFACQYEGARADRVPLLGVHRPGQPAVLLDLGRSEFSFLHHYIGSITTSGDGRTIIVTSPRAGRILEISTATRRLTSTAEIPDICGLATAGSGYFASDGSGSIWQDRRILAQIASVSWDNHLGAIR